jgi:hypothetical protein
MKVRFTPRAFAAAKRMKTWWLEPVGHKVVKPALTIPTAATLSS